jgi:hypothetical protein
MEYRFTSYGIEVKADENGIYHFPLWKKINLEFLNVPTSSVGHFRLYLKSVCNEDCSETGHMDFHESCLQHLSNNILVSPGNSRDTNYVKRYCHGRKRAGLIMGGIFAKKLEFFFLRNGRKTECIHQFHVFGYIQETEITIAVNCQFSANLQK